jgi:hypothetical protein
MVRVVRVRRPELHTYLGVKPGSPGVARARHGS